MLFPRVMGSHSGGMPEWHTANRQTKVG